MSRVLAVRWAIGDADPQTIAALERSMAGVRVAFGRSARMAVCVHSVSAAAVQERARVPPGSSPVWLQVDHDVPVFVRRRVDLSMAGGFAWRFAPLRVFSGCCEVVLATDCVVEAIAGEVRRWAATPGQRRCLVAFGAPGRDAIAARGVPASFDLEDALETSLSEAPELLASAGDAIAAELASLSFGAPPVVLRPGTSQGNAAIHHPSLLSP